MLEGSFKAVSQCLQLNTRTHEKLYHFRHLQDFCTLALLKIHKLKSLTFEFKMKQPAQPAARAGRNVPGQNAFSFFFMFLVLAEKMFKSETDEKNVNGF